MTRFVVGLVLGAALGLRASSWWWRSSGAGEWDGRQVSSWYGQKT